MEGLLNGDRREQTSLRQRGTDFVVAGDHSSRCQGLDLEWEAARDTHRSGALAAALYVSRHYSDHSLRELGQLAGGMEYAAVTVAIRRFEKRLLVDKKLAKRLNHTLKMLQVKT